MVYRPKNQGKDIFISETRLRLGHETLSDAPDLRNLRAEVYDGIKTLLHHHTIDNRMASCRDVALKDRGVKEEN
jgi:hypothetical protein